MLFKLTELAKPVEMPCRRCNTRLRCPRSAQFWPDAILGNDSFSGGNRLAVDAHRQLPIGAQPASDRQPASDFARQLMRGA